MSDYQEMQDQLQDVVDSGRASEFIESDACKQIIELCVRLADEQGIEISDDLRNFEARIAGWKTERDATD